MQLIADNVTRLTKDKLGGGVGRLIATGVPNGNAQRISKGDKNYGINTVEMVAEKLGVPAWRLCVPPEVGAVGAWPLDPFISRQDWEGLTPPERHAVAWEASQAIDLIKAKRRPAGAALIEAAPLVLHAVPVPNEQPPVDPDKQGAAAPKSGRGARKS